MLKHNTDKNQKQLVTIYRDLGMSVAILSKVGKGIPDLLIGGLMPCSCGSGRVARQSKIVEVKSLKGILTPDQQEFHRTWHGQIDIVRTEAQALAAVGINQPVSFYGRYLSKKNK